MSNTSTIKLSKTIQDVVHSPTLWVNDHVKQKRNNGQTVLHMGFGESPFPVPERLKKALAKAAHRKEYLPADGLNHLTETAKEYYRPLLGNAVVDNSDVIIAPGSKLILYSLQMAIEGDLVMPVPSWVSYSPQARMLGNKIIKVQATLDNQGYHLSADLLQDSIRSARLEGRNPTKLILNSPSNPTGLRIPESEMEAIANVCINEGIFIISDEIYGQVTYDNTYSSISKFAPDLTAITSGLSKHLSLGGWRIGIGFIPKNIDGLHDALCRISSETWSCVPSPIQEASIEAYKRHSDIEVHIQQCTDIHTLMNQYISKELNNIGVLCATAQGAFYNYPDFSPFKEKLSAKGISTARALQEHLLDRYNLATLPGSSFGEDENKLTLRLSGCDYNGHEALNAYQEGAMLDNDFILDYAPNIASSLEAFRTFIQSL